MSDIEISICYHFYQRWNERSVRFSLSRIVELVGIVQSLFSYEGIISIAVKNDHVHLGVALCFDFVYY